MLQIDDGIPIRFWRIRLWGTKTKKAVINIAKWLGYKIMGVSEGRVFGGNWFLTKEGNTYIFNTVLRERMGVREKIQTVIKFIKMLNDPSKYETTQESVAGGSMRGVQAD